MRMSTLITAVLAGGASLFAAAGTGAAVGGQDWTTYGYDAQRTGYNPLESTIGPANVGGLHELWSHDLGGVVDTQPVVASGVSVAGSPRDLVYAGSEAGLLQALDLRSGAVVWSRQLGSVVSACRSEPYGITGAPVIDRAAGALYAADGKGELWALDLATGATRQGWPVRLTTHPAHEHVWSALTQHGATLYAAFASLCDNRPYRGRIVAVDSGARRISAAWYPLGQDGKSGGAIWGWGGGSIDERDGSVYVTTGNGFGQNEARPYAEAVARLTAGLGLVAAHQPPLTGTDVDFGSTPTLFQAPGCPPQLAAENKDGAFFLYDRDTIASGPVQRLQIASLADWELIGMPAWSPVTHDLYVADSSDSADGIYHRGLIAFHVGQDCRLSIAWQAPVVGRNTVMSTPTVANGVVYYADGNLHQVHALNAATGAPLWSTTLSSAVFAAPTVVDGTLLFASWDHRVHAWVPG